MTLFIRVGDSEVLNDIGTFSVEAAHRAMTAAERENAAPEAVGTVEVDIPTVLRSAAAELEGELEGDALWEEKRAIVEIYQREWEKRDPVFSVRLPAREQLEAQFRFRLATALLEAGYRKIGGE